MEPWEKYAQKPKGNPWDRYAQSGPSTTDYTANPKSEGLYRMLPKSSGDAIRTSDEVQVPFSRVQDAISAGYDYHPDEKARYEKDLTYAGQGPTLTERAGQAIQGALAPSTAPRSRTVEAMAPEMWKAAGRVVAATPGFLMDFSKALFDPQTVRDSKGIAYLRMIDPSQVPEQLQKQFSQDMKTGGTKFAVQNLIGSIGGMGAVGALTHGATEAIKGTVPNLPAVKRGAEGIRNFVREQVEMPQRIERTVQKFGDESERVRQQNQTAEEQTEMAKGKVDESNKTAAEKHAEDLEKHNKEVVRLAKEHRVKVAEQEKAHADALQKHQDDTKAVQTKNVKALQEHLETSGKIAKDNQAAMDAIKARQAGEQQLAQDTAEFRQRIDAAEKKANAENDVAWDNVRNATAGHETDIAPLKQVVETARAQADPASSPIFKSILNEGEGGGVDPQGRPIVNGQARIVWAGGKEVPLSDQHYATYYEIQYGEPPPLNGAAGKTNFARLQRWYTYLGSKMYGGSGRMEAGTYNALKITRNAINDAMKDITQQVGNVPDPADPSKTVSATSLLDNARKLHTEKMEAFADSPSEPRTVASAYEKSKVPESVKETTEAEWGKKLERYDPRITELGESIRETKEGLKEVPTEDEARKMVKPLPQPPVSAPLPVAPVAPEPLPGPQYPVPPVAPEPNAYGEPKAKETLPDVTKINQENITFLNDALRRYGKVGPWVFRLLTGGLLEHLIKGESSAFGGTLMVGQGGLMLVTKLLRGPGALEWLARPSEADIKVIESLPPKDAARLKLAFKALADEEIRQDPKKADIKIDPRMQYWLGPKGTELAPGAKGAYIGGETAANKEKGNEKKKADPADLKRQAEELQNSFHRGGFAQSPAPQAAPGPQSSAVTHRFNPANGRIEAA